MRQRVLLIVLVGLGLLVAACDGDGGAGSGADGAGGGDGTSGADASIGADTAAGGGPDASADVPSGGATFETCIPPRTPDFLLQTLELATATGDLRVRLQVEPGEGNAVGETFPFDLVGFALEREGALVCVVDPAALAYEWGHHNWDETATATHEGVRYTVTMTLQWEDVGGELVPTWADRIVATDASGATLWGPLDLTVSRCEAEGSGALNGCFHREKVDL